MQLIIDQQEDVVEALQVADRVVALEDLIVARVVQARPPWLEADEVKNCVPLSRCVGQCN